MATEGIDIEVPNIAWAVRDLPGGDPILLLVIEASGSHHEFFVANNDTYTAFYTEMLKALRKAGNDLHLKSKPKLIEVKGVLPNGSQARLRP